MRLLAGYELTFTNPSLIAAGAARGDFWADTLEQIAACTAFTRALRAAIGEHRHAVEDDGHGLPRHVITYPDGYWIKVENDPWVVEVTGQPLTLDGYRAHAARFAQIFETARRCGLAPHDRIGGGHVHLDRASFGSAAALRNFIVDYVNRPSLALGGLGHDLLNAPPLALAPRRNLAAFADGLAAFDAGALDLDGWLRQIGARVYTFGSRRLPREADPSKYQALNVSHRSTIEIRAIRPQRDFATLVRVIHGLEARAARLAAAPPVPFALGYARPHGGPIPTHPCGA